MRLVAAGAIGHPPAPGAGADPGAIVAGVEIRLDPNFKTYWRTPGDAGIPPSFDWSGSQNVSDISVLFPAPVRFADGAGFSIGYKGGVVLPVRARAIDPAKPAVLALRLDYAVCEKLCIPASGQARLAVPEVARASSPHATRIAAALAAVPVRAALGAPASPMLVAVEGVVRGAGDGAPGGLRVRLRGPAPLDLFAEGPDGWLFGTAAIGERDGEDVLATLPIEDKPKPARFEGLEIVFTVTAGPIEGTGSRTPAAATETSARLDATGRSR